MKQQLMLLKVSVGLILLLYVTVASQAHAKSAIPPPSPSRGALDIGQVGRTGAFVENGDTDRIWASGSDIGGQHDQFHYVWYDLPADGQMVARVLGQDATNDWAKAGIMLRDTTADNAPYVLLAQTPHHTVTFQARKATGNESIDLRDISPVTAPTWLKLVRRHTTITGFVSVNGTIWTTVSSLTLTMGANSSIGLAVTAHNNKVRSRAVFARVKLTLGQAAPSLIASRVYGQNEVFTTATANASGVSATSLNYPQGITVDSNGNLYVVDGSNNRVLYYPSGTTTATRVYGQPDFTTTTKGASATSLSSPGAAVVDSSGNLYVVDTSNNRVLYYPSGTTTATRVYGQPDFTTTTSNTGGISATSLSSPWGITVDSSGNLYIADYSNNRVLYYPSGTTTATRVYGQPDFTTTTSNTGGISATSLSSPWGITVDSSGNLYIADYGNNRVLYYPSGTTTATRVYGQPDFTTTTSNTGGISATSLYEPGGIAVDSSDNLYILDYGNSRVLYYPSGTTTATQVYGQAGNFSSNTTNNGGISAGSLSSPYGIALDSSGNLYVADYDNSRVLMFPYA